MEKERNIQQRERGRAEEILTWQKLEEEWSKRQ